MSGIGPPPDIKSMISIKIDNITYRTTPDQLRSAFERFGDVGDVYIPRDRLSRSRGFAFVRYYDRRDANDALAAMDGAMLDGRELRCTLARYGRPADQTLRDIQKRSFDELLLRHSLGLGVALGIAKPRSRSRSPRGSKSASRSVSSSSNETEQKVAPPRGRAQPKAPPPPPPDDDDSD